MNAWCEKWMRRYAAVQRCFEHRGARHCAIEGQARYRALHSTEVNSRHKSSSSSKPELTGQEKASVPTSPIKEPSEARKFAEKQSRQREHEQLRRMAEMASQCMMPWERWHMDDAGPKRAPLSLWEKLYWLLFSCVAVPALVRELFFSRRHRRCDPALRHSHLDHHSQPVNDRALP